MIMAAPLHYCTIVEQREVVSFIWARGVKLVEIHCRMLSQYESEKRVIKRNVYEQVGSKRRGILSETVLATP